MKFSVLGDCSNKPLGGERSILLSYGDNIQMSNEFSCPNHPFNSTLLILFYQTHQGMSSKTPAKIIQKSKSKLKQLKAKRSKPSSSS